MKPYLKKNKAKRTEGTAEVGEHLLSRHEVLNSNSSNAYKKKCNSSGNFKFYFLNVVLFLYIIDIDFSLLVHIVFIYVTSLWSKYV
jgi:hypothetical protein